LKKLATIVSLSLLISCSADDRVDDPIPFHQFEDVVINVTLPAYVGIQIVGGHTVIPDAGIRGIIVYRKSQNTFLAFEQNCSFQPYEAGSNVQPFATYMQDAYCGSLFDYDGNPMGGGIAWRPLGQYETIFSGSILTITDNVINY
jgi:hypothetical protein